MITEMDTIHKLCRICLQESQNMKSLWDHQEVNLMFESLTNHKLEISELTPYLLCRDCEDNLNSSYNFQKLCLESDEKLKLQLHLHKTKTSQAINNEEVEERSPSHPNITPQLSQVKGDRNRSVGDSKRECLDNREQQQDTSSCKRRKKESSPLVFVVKPGSKNTQTSENIKNTHQEIIIIKGADDDSTSCENESSGMEQKPSRGKKRKKSGNNNFQCHLCEIIKSNRRQLLKHLRTNHEEYKKPHRYACSYCDKKFMEKYFWVEHERIHTGEKPFVCEICGFACKQKSYIRTHMYQHSERPFSCSQCEKKCSTSSELKVHTRIHTGERPYLCSICGKSYRKGSCLSDHHKAAHENKLYQCDFCKKTYKSRATLKEHVTCGHTSPGVKPFKCPQCPFASNRQTNLRKHTKTHADPDARRKFNCHICEKVFNYKGSLKVHIGAVHNTLGPVEEKKSNRKTKME